ncbi:hypothetical protein Tco_0841742 [Tanacetum coccineum]|uniref:Uncharacterized protein n=1 Tax=Tanacetum coccineum TaxID=301880 RepID=A0ABQ5AX88_9ASTR
MPALLCSQGETDEANQVKDEEKGKKNERLTVQMPTTTSTLTSVSAQDLLSTGTIFSDLNSFMLNSNPLFNIPGFKVQEFKPAMGFQFHENGGYQEDGGRMMFPFKVMNQQLSSTRDNGQVFVPGPSENLGVDDDDGNDGSNGCGDGGDYNHE